MKINRFGALATIVLLVVGAMGAIANQSFAMDSHNTTGIQAHTSFTQPKVSAIQVQGPVLQTQSCAQDQTDGSEVNSASADTDNVDLQCGDQNTPDVGSAPGQKTLGASSDTGGNTDQQVGDQSGDQNSPDTGGQTP